MADRVQPTGFGNPQWIIFRLGPLALAVWNGIKSILLAKEDKLGAYPHPSVDFQKDHPRKNLFGT